MFFICKFKSFFIVAISALIFFHCSNYKPTTAGYPYRIFIVADSLLWLDIKKPVSDVFEGEVLTPVSEKKFYFTWIPLRLLNEFKHRMNIFFIGIKNEEGEVNEYLRQVLPDEFQKGVQENRYFYLFLFYLFARGQIGLFMFARDRQTFLKDFADLKDEIYNTFEKKYFARLKESMFDKGEQFKVEEYIKNNFDFSIRVQHDYFVAIEEPQVPYLWLRRFDPDRWVSIWKIKGDSSYFNFDSIANVRDRFTKKYYEGDYVIREDSKLITADFNGQQTAKMVGLWRNDSVLIGGPFRTYVIDHPQDSSLYFVDIAVMAPGHLKKPYLDQLEVIARTFRIEDRAEKHQQPDQR